MEPKYWLSLLGQYWPYLLEPQYWLYLLGQYWVYLVGFVGQGLFASRFLVQWLASERKGESVIPIYFWYLSLTGGLITLAYAILQREPVFMVAQSIGSVVYIRNLMLIYRKRAAAADLSPS